MREHVVNSLEDLERVLEQTRPGTNLRLGELLLEEEVVPREALDDALAQQQREPGRHLGEILMERGAATREQIDGAVARKLGIPFITLGDFVIEPTALRLIPHDIAIQYGILPLGESDGRLIVAMENPFDWEALEVLRFHTNRPVEAVVTTSREISRALEKYYHHHSDQTIEEVADIVDFRPVGDPASSEPTNLDSVKEQARRKPVVRLVNAIILQGIMHAASDINIRPEHDRVNIYYRVDGKLQFARSLHKSLLAPIVSRIKILGRMDIAERRLPQDGNMRVTYSGKGIDLRLSVVPTVNGESVVLRILDKSAGFKPLEQLGLGEKEYRTLRELMSYSYGMLLVTGPTGSGKSTTLYAILQVLRENGPHILTVEDPVEYDMEGVEQIPIQSGLGYTFAEALRHILRHDPDVVMVGEIRDTETARIANKAALTGHLVLSTLHTNDAPSAVTRLLDMEVEPYLLSSTLLGVMAQRLVRVNCEHCKAEESVEPEVRKALGVAEGETFYRGTGCQSCNYTGYHGRIVVSELLAVSPRIAELIGEGASYQRVRAAALEEGMAPFTRNAVELARSGRTSLAEVYSVRLS